MLCEYLILKVIILGVWKKKKKLVISWRAGRPEEKERKEKLLSETARTHTTFID